MPARPIRLESLATLFILLFLGPSCISALNFDPLNLIYKPAVQGRADAGANLQVCLLLQIFVDIVDDGVRRFEGVWAGERLL